MSDQSIGHHNADEDLAPVPPHVSPQDVVDFDFYNPPGAHTDFHSAWAKLQEDSGGRIVWTPRNGGHWMPTSGSDVYEILADYRHFSSGLVILPESRGKDQRALPTSINPPAHTAYRALLNPGVAPKAVMKMEPAIRDLAAQTIESFRNEGRCDFIADYSTVLPLGIFMQLVDLPQADIPRLKYLADQVTRPDGSMTMSDLMDAFLGYLRPYLRDRRDGRGVDMLTQIASGRIDGEPISEDAALDMACQLLLGGMDTVASFLGFTMLFLANNPGHRRQLIEEPQIIPQAVDEFFRRFPLVSLTRTVAEDYVWRGTLLKKGDYLCVPTMMHGIDPQEFPEPFKVDFKRGIHQHSTFGNGAHRCPGAFLARTELRITLEEWLKRIPDFEIAGEVAMSGGIVGSVEKLPLRWEPA